MKILTDGKLVARISWCLRPEIDHQFGESIVFFFFVALGASGEPLGASGVVWGSLGFSWEALGRPWGDSWPHLGAREEERGGERRRERKRRREEERGEEGRREEERAGASNPI